MNVPEHTLLKWLDTGSEKQQRLAANVLSTKGWDLVDKINGKDDGEELEKTRYAGQPVDDSWLQTATVF